MIAIQIGDDAFKAQMKNILDQVKRPISVLAAVGREGANQLRRHFLDKDRTDVNKLAPDRRQHIWQRIAHSVQAPVVSDHEVTIAITDPIIAQKVFGGTITAKRAGALTIPESEDAYGRAPSVFEQETGLKLFLVRANDHAFLASRRSDTSKALQVEYLLTPSVTQDADPTALPSDKELQEAVLDRAQKVLDRQLKEGGKS